MDAAPYMIEVQGIEKSFGGTRALHGVSFALEQGKVLGLLGPNGAGKTTLVKILTTLLAADGGSARVGGFDIVQEKEKIREIIGLAGQYATMDDNLTGRENLEMVARLYHLPRREATQRAQEILERFALLDAADRVVKGYSGGMRRRLDLGASLIARPQIVFLDEPTAGLDPRTRADLWDMIHALVQDGITILLTTQYLEEADELANTIIVLDEGTIVAEGTSDELKARIGADVLELTVAYASDIDRAAEAMKPLVAYAHHVGIDRGAKTVSVLVQGGAQSLVMAVRELDQRQVELADIKLRRPSLDDVFLSITRRPGRDQDNAFKEGAD